MNYGSLGLVTGNGEFLFEQDIIKAFCLGDKSVLYGLYYPCPPSSVDSAYENATTKDDFIFTPIPPSYWAITARLHICLKEETKALNKLCDFIRSKKISIIHAESTRSTFKYATWSLHIAFESLLDDEEMEYKKELLAYDKVHAESQKFERQILYKFKDTILYDKGVDAIKITANSQLPYFDDYIKNNHDWIKKGDSIFLLPFKLEQRENSKGHKLLQGDHTCTAIIKRMKWKVKDLFPGTTYCELDTKSLILRTALISEKDSKRLFKVNIDYTRNGKPYSCAGIFYEITDRLAGYYNLWHTYNYIMESSKTEESGRITLLIENISFKKLRNSKGAGRLIDNRTASSYVDEAKSHFNEIVNDFNKKGRNISLKCGEILSLPQGDIFQKIFEIDNSNRFRKYSYDLFISYSHADKEFVENYVEPILLKMGIRYFRDVKHIKSGQKIDKEILNGIKNTQEMCVIYSKDSHDSEWVITESGAAWILDMNITPIVIQPTEVRNLYKLNNSIIIETSHKQAKKRQDSVLNKNPKNKWDYIQVDKKNVISQIEKYAKEIIDRRNQNEAELYKQLFLK